MKAIGYYKKDGKAAPFHAIQSFGDDKITVLVYVSESEYESVEIDIADIVNKNWVDNGVQAQQAETVSE